MSSEIEYRVIAGVGRATIRRPEVRNALGWKTWQELANAVVAAREDPSVHALIVRGDDGVFSAGGDIKTMGPRGTGVRAPALRLRLVHEVMTAVWQFPKPVFAAVEGPVVGVGWSLAQACDYVIAGNGSFFTAAFARRGLVPDGGLAWMLARRLGHQRAAELLYEGRRLPASEAAQMGLVNEVVDDGHSLSRCEELAERLRALSADALQGTKSQLRQALETGFAGFLAYEELMVALTWYGDDAREGRQAFLEKREPRFASRAHERAGEGEGSR
jgi:2-(1,2-epoxy-1,2-dihydrophenyl)acetyl-CoA isomerase